MSIAIRVLIADDEPNQLELLSYNLSQSEFEVIRANDGQQALEMIEDHRPDLVILDWMMPGHDGTWLCEHIRQRDDGTSFYILLLTAKMQKEDIVEGLGSGADDYVTKPFHRDELHARVQTGIRIIDLQSSLATRIEDLERALTEIKQLKGMLPICAYCKRIREGDDYWQQVEEYLASHSDAQLSHAVCPDCYANVVRRQLEEME